MGSRRHLCSCCEANCFSMSGAGFQGAFTNRAERPAQLREMQTVPYDPRFQNTNQARNCWQNYVDYHRCVNLKGEDFEPCQFFFKNFTALCPMEWVEKWDDQRDAGSFPAKL